MIGIFGVEQRKIEIGPAEVVVKFAEIQAPPDVEVRFDFPLQIAHPALADDGDFEIAYIGVDKFPYRSYKRCRVAAFPPESAHGDKIDDAVFRRRSDISEIMRIDDDGFQSIVIDTVQGNCFFIDRRGVLFDVVGYA